MSEKPDFVPAHRPAGWLSSEDVFAAIHALAENGTDKAACWDFTIAVRALALKAGNTVGSSHIREG